MNAIAILFCLGIILLAFEVIVPGGILGVLGTLALLGGVAVAFTTHGTRGGLSAVGVAVVLLGLTAALEFLVLPRTKLGKRMFLQSSISATSQAAVAPASLVGQTGEALTPLSPSGYVDVSGRRYEAFSQSGRVAPGDKLRVVGVDNFRIIVTKI
jgi:membrane-bound ClpP family serine protease